MQERKIFLARHAKPDSPDDEKRFLGQTDNALSAEGLMQAENLARELAKHQISAIYSSDLLRASQTASIIAAKFNLPVKTEKRLREIHMGDWENLTFAEVRSKYLNEYDKRGKDLARYRRPGGESFTDVRDRALAGFNEIVLSSTGNVVVVAHAGVNRVILCGLISVPIQDMFTIKINYASAYEISVIENGIKLTGNILN
jgi:alpha-ribazole phosphatase